jgi:two-component system cell cycle response regulator DivK
LVLQKSGVYIVNNPLALIIEDDAPHANLFSEALQKAGFEIEVIRDGQVAIARLAEITPALVVLDLHLPHVSGEDILKHIRNDARLVKTRIVVASADPQMASMLRDKADLVLIKPISYFQLKELAIRLRGSTSPLGE